MTSSHYGQMTRQQLDPCLFPANDLYALRSYATTIPNDRSVSVMQDGRCGSKWMQRLSAAGPPRSTHA